MRSPNKPGHTPYVPPVPSWVGQHSTDLINLDGGVDRASGLVISDLHFDSITAATPAGGAGHAISLRRYDNVTIERCTFANCSRAMYFDLCTNVTIRDCAFYNIRGWPDGSRGQFALFNTGSGFLVEDCWGINDPAQSDPEDLVSFFKSNNSTARRCRFFGGGTTTSGAGILLGDGLDASVGGGDNLLAEDNVLIDCNIAAIGTNCTVRNNRVLGRGLIPVRDAMRSGIFAGRSSSHPDNPVGPFTIEDNESLWYKSNGSVDPAIHYPTVGVTYTGIGSNPVRPLIDEFTAWTPTGYYGWTV